MPGRYPPQATITITGDLIVTVGTPVDAAQLVAQLVVGQGEKIGELNEGHGAPTGERLANTTAQDRRFRQRRVAHAIGKLGAQSTGHAENVPFGIFDVLAQQVNVGVRAHLMTQHFAHRFTHVQSRTAGGSVPFARGMCQLDRERQFGGQGRDGFRAGVGRGLGLRHLHLHRATNLLQRCVTVTRRQQILFEVANRIARLR